MHICAYKSNLADYEKTERSSISDAAWPRGPKRREGQEFQVTRDNCFLRDSHSAPERMRGATSMRRGVSLKTSAAFQGWPSRVRYSRTLRASAMLVKEMSWTIISARNRRVCISSGS